MATVKSSVRKLDGISTATKRITANGKGLGGTLDDVVTKLNSVIAANLIVVNSALGAAGVALAATKSKVKTAAAIKYRVNGQIYSLGATDNFWTLTGAAFTTARGYLLCVDNAGAASVVASPNAATPGAIVWPALPANKSVIGFVTIAAGAGTPTFTPGTTLLDATDLVVAYGDGVPEAATNAQAPSTLPVAVSALV